MSPEGHQNLKHILFEDEGFRQFPYMDTTGHLTIGIGRNLTSNGISFQEASALLDNDINYFISKLKDCVPSFDSLCESRQIVLVDMCFNLGVKGFLEFHNMLAAISRQDWSAAAEDIINCKAATQTGKRYERLSQIMKTGMMEDKVCSTES